VTTRDSKSKAKTPAERKGADLSRVPIQTRRQNVKRSQKHQSGLHQSGHNQRLFYAEDANQELAKHQRSCTDPACADQMLRWGGRQESGKGAVASFTPGDNRVYLRLYDQGFIVLMLAEQDTEFGLGREGLSKLKCAILGIGQAEHASLTFDPLCHQGDSGGTMLGLLAAHPGHVAVVCANKDCDTVLCTFALAKRPVAEYPNTFCPSHGIEPGYMTCIHVLDGAAPYNFSPATETEPGEARCRECGDFNSMGEFKERVRFMHIVCQHVIDHATGGKLNELISATKDVSRRTDRKRSA
jgi:hypothetical protein